MKKNIILIGMPGVGKSTVGVVLAKVMGYQFIDADLVIQEKEGKLLPPKSGLFVIAAQAGVDVVPVRIRYDTPDGKMRLFCRVNVIYGEPMPAARFSMEGRRDLRKLRENKQAVLEAWEKL